MAALFVLLALVLAACQPITAPPATVETLVTGAAMHGANGLYVGPDGNLTIASFWGQEIVVLDPETGVIQQRLGPDAGVLSPDDVVFGRDGSLYWTDLTAGEVGHRTLDGVVTKQVVAPGVNPITFSDDGRLFVALDFMGDGLYELDPALSAPPRQIVPEMGWFNGMDWGPDGQLYGVVWMQAKIAKVDVDTGVVTPVADLTGSAPAAVKFDSQGRLYAVEQMRGDVMRIDPAAGAVDVIATLAPGLDNLAFDAQDRLFVSNAHTGAVVEVLADGQVRTVQAGGLIGPSGLAVLPAATEDMVWVGDVWTLRCFDGASGAIEESVPYAIGTTGGMIAPMTVALGPDAASLVITSWIDNAAQIWNVVESAPRMTVYELAAPVNAIAFEDGMAVAELGTGSVVLLKGDPVQRTVLASNLAVPSGMAATADALWVAEWATGRILQVVDKGWPLDVPKEIATGLAGPEGMALAPDGNLLVVESHAGRLVSVNPTTGALTVIASDLALGVPGPQAAPPLWFFNGVTVSPTGTIYVTGDTANVLYRIQPATGLVAVAEPW
jgi:sugar lactone lactonase YvrE